MNDAMFRWPVDAEQWLNETLGLINRSRGREEPLARADEQCQALVKIWHDYLQCRGQMELGADRDVPEIMSQGLEKVLDVVFDHPSTRLAVYGTLAPGKENESQLAGIDGTWGSAAVRGTVNRSGRYPEFRWVTDEPLIPIEVFSASELPDHWDRLDRFEGARYRRILVPVISDERWFVCNVYEGVAE